MKHYQVRLYLESDFKLWNAFVEKAKNATFLFHRDFMEYHKDRFEDHSLLIFDGEELAAILPAHKKSTTVYSHQGLTYGGFVLRGNAKLGQVIDIVKNTLSFLHSKGITTLTLKLIPRFYCDYFSEEINYCLFLLQAKNYRNDALSVLDLTKDFTISTRRRAEIRKGTTEGLSVKEETNFESFWNEILIPNLDKKHQAKPVHSLDEITKLRASFPENIRHFNVYHNHQLVAGTTIFSTDTVAHPQYVSGNAVKNETGSLDFLYHHLITEIYKDKHYFDFGPSHEENGTKINSGVLFWKESFGAKTTVQGFYEIQTSNYNLLEGILL